MALKDWKRYNGGWFNFTKKLHLEINKEWDTKVFYKIYIKSVPMANIIDVKIEMTYRDALKFVKSYMRKH
jgi:hypothetical protein